MVLPAKMPYLCGKQQFQWHLFWSKIAKKGPHSIWKKSTNFHVAWFKVRNAVEKCMEQWLEITKISINILGIEQGKYYDQIRPKQHVLCDTHGQSVVWIVLNFVNFQCENFNRKWPHPANKTLLFDGEIREFFKNVKIFPIRRR